MRTFQECFRTGPMRWSTRTHMKCLRSLSCLQKPGDIDEKMMYNTYNMGIGMMVAVDEKSVNDTLEALERAGETAFVVGEIKAGEKGVTVC